ncbi:MAG: hypothetical protein GX757_03200 [Clostridiales bacterium]|nr:hypothetical protein [Clostridiales bacterium]
MNIEDYGFKKLDASDRDLFSYYYKKMNDNWASSICFPSMLAWNTGIVIYHKIIGDYICCVAHDIPNARWVLLPLIGHCSKISHRQAAHTYSAAYCWQGFRQAFT